MQPRSSEEPGRNPRPPAGLLIGVVAVCALIAAAFILVFATRVPFVVRALLAAVDLLVASLACWAIAKSLQR